MTIESDKAGLLAAVAAAGTRGAEDFKAAQAQLAQQQSEAVRMALANGVASNAPAGALAEVERIVGSGYQGRQAQLTSNAATSADYFNKLGAGADVFMTQANALIPAIQEQYRLAQLGKGSGSGSGGGSSDWFDPLKEQFDTKANFYNYLEQQGTDRIPTSIAAAKLAAEYGVPEGVIAARFPQSEYLSEGLASIETARQAKVPLRRFRRRLVKNARITPGPNRIERRFLVDLYRGGPPPGRR